jgi:secreted Zn-dependent insulinase-like peptidase
LQLWQKVSLLICKVILTFTVDFRFKEKQSPSSYASALAHNMHTYAYEHILSGGMLFFEQDKKAIEEFGNYLTPENML